MEGQNIYQKYYSDNSIGISEGQICKSCESGSKEMNRNSPWNYPQFTTLI